MLGRAPRERAGWKVVETLRLPLFVIAAVLVVLALFVDMGGLLIHPTSQPAALQTAIGQHGQGAVSADQLAAASQGQSSPGLGVPYLALVDAVLVFTIAIIAAGIFFPQSLEGRLQGIATLVFAVLLVLAAIGLVFVAIAKLLLMLGLLLAFPFGPLIYLAIFGFFDRARADIILSLSMLLKVAAAVCLVLAQQRFLENVGLVLIVLTTLAATVVVSFLLGFPPIVLVSITDAIAAIVVAVLAIIWAVVLLVGSIPGILNALRPQKSLA